MSKKYVLVVKQKKIGDKTFPQYALRDMNDETLWLSANLTQTAQAKVTIDKPVFPVAIELDNEDYFISKYSTVNKVTGEVVNVPKVVIKSYKSINHIELPQKTIDDIFATIKASK